MARNLGLAKIPTLNPDAAEGDEISMFDRGVLRVINNNFELINVAMSSVQSGQDLLENNVFGAFTGEFVDHLPVVRQPGIISQHAGSYGRYMAIGNLIVYIFHAHILGTGTAGNAVLVQTPTNINENPTSSNTPKGAGFIYDASTGTVYNGVWTSPALGNQLGLLHHTSSTSAGAFPNFGLVNTAQVAGMVCYESRV